MKKTGGKGLGLAVIFMIPAVPLVSADVFLKQRQYGQGIEAMGQAQQERDLINTIWITDDKVRSDNEEDSYIIRLDKGVTYFLDHREKTYTEIPMDISKMPSAQIPGADKEEMEQFKNMMQSMMKMEISVTPTGERKKIGKWTCQKYIQKITTLMGPMETEIWATEEIKVNYDAHTKFASAVYASLPGMQQMAESFEREMKKIKGVAVQTKSSNTVRGYTFTSGTELLEARQGQAPAGFFDLPNGYTKTEMPGPMR